MLYGFGDNICDLHDIKIRKLHKIKICLEKNIAV